ncbi:hypothetical protein A3F29_04265 [Candidatus Roizmanbacteria bacterium RIFCSPHIGHO2_12_FULL_33_9]|uniref:Uncharacterized protein n=1 Tax=Candidatus Roizmanbacteria bacterium RIFCSPHIGHO2_12_FULL_33_9 TaxID=1802045 RepID=A0A1F7HIN9_9BACT|nr:MAG: hypothetical protein A3F29_04265 [Candidatus Roizmanbacteria bacterium RIFCSPHIGHO2_12_FULL_33_9]
MLLSKKLLLWTLLIVLFIDLIIFFTYFVYPKIFKKKEFYTSNSLYKLKDGEIKLYPGSENNDGVAFGFAMLQGFIKSTPYVDNGIKKYVLPIEWKSNGRNIPLFIILGDNDADLYFLLAKRGAIPDLINEKIISVKNSISLFKKNRPVIISYFYDNPSLLRKISANRHCNKECQKTVEESAPFTKNTELLLKNSGKTNGLFIGPAYSFILYVN